MNDEVHGMKDENYDRAWKEGYLEAFRQINADIKFRLKIYNKYFKKMSFEEKA